MLYKTIWRITDETTKNETDFTYYHFGREPKFPCWYFEEGRVYTIEMIWNLQLSKTLKLFYKCLTHSYSGKKVVDK